MAWGKDGEESREVIRTELALARVPMYRLRTAVMSLEHPEKGPRLRGFVDEVYASLEKIEATLRQ